MTSCKPEKKHRENQITQLQNELLTITEQSKNFEKKYLGLHFCSFKKKYRAN